MVPAEPSRTPPEAAAGLRRKRPVRVSSDAPGRRIGALSALGAVWGPGLLVMLVDTDAGNIVAAADAGARWGYRLVVLPLLLIPALALVQDLAVRIGIFGGGGFGALVRARLGRPWRWIIAAALVAASLGSLVTEFAGIAGVGDLFGVPRPAALGLAGLCLVAAVPTGHHRRVERLALLLGLFAFAFFAVAWHAHPSAAALARDLADQRWSDAAYLVAAAGLIGATFNPWMVFYQASALAAKRLTPAHVVAARCETIAGAVLTQALTAAVVTAVAAAALPGGRTGLDSVGRIGDALTPVLGAAIGRWVFGIGVVGAAMAAAVVCSLACVGGLGELFGLRSEGAAFRAGYTLCVAVAAALVGAAPDLVGLGIAAQVLNAVLLPIVGGLLVAVCATALPVAARLRGVAVWVAAGTVALVGAVGFAGALAALL